MKYEIWQANADTEMGRKIAFCSYKFSQKYGLVASKDCYNKVYESECWPIDGSCEATLEHLFMKLNIGAKPEGYTGHSLSVSDVIILEGDAYYVDDFGFKKIDF